MKRFMFVLSFVLGFLSLSAQTVTLGEVTRGFKVDTTTATGETYLFVANGQQYEYNIYSTSNGSPYIISIGSKGQYPVWIGSEHPTYKVPAGTALPEGSPLRVSSSGKAVIPYIKGNGHPHVNYVPFTPSGSEN